MIESWGDHGEVTVEIDENGDIIGWCATLVALGLVDRESCPVRGVDCAHCLCG
jgi:hypothetical protein